MRSEEAGSAIKSYADGFWRNRTRESQAREIRWMLGGSLVTHVTAMLLLKGKAAQVHWGFTVPASQEAFRATARSHPAEEMKMKENGVWSSLRPAPPTASRGSATTLRSVADCGCLTVELLIRDSVSQSPADC